jgi:putative ABC transport system permease protein
MDRFWVEGFSEETLSDSSAKTLAARPGLNYSHLLPTLKRKVDWQGRATILVGIAEEVPPVDHKMPSMSWVIERGTVFVGQALAARLDLRKGSTIDLLGKPFRVAACLPESGTDQDVSILGHLADVQALLGMDGLINEIQALDCVCLDRNRDSLDVLREQLAAALPEARVIQVRTLAGVRETQRRLVEDSIGVALPFVLVIAALWVGVLAWLNVRERWREIGILRALGHGSARIAALFLGKAVAVGLIGALIGYAAGTWLALACGPEIFRLTGKGIAPLPELLAWALLGAPILAAVASLVPAAVAVAQDPAVALREDAP